MDYKLDPKERSDEFVSKAYDLYLKKLYKGKESIKSVKVITKEVPAGKTIEELTSLGFLPRPNNSDIEVPYDPNASSRDLDPVKEPKQPKPPLPPPQSAPVQTPAPEILGPSTEPWVAPPQIERPEEPAQEERIEEVAPKATSSKAKPLIHFYDDMLNVDISRKERYVLNLREISNVVSEFARLRRINNFLTGYKDTTSTTSGNARVFKNIIYTSRVNNFKKEVCSFKQIANLQLNTPKSIILNYNFYEDYLEEKYDEVTSLESRLSELIFILSNKLFQKTIADSFKLAASGNSNVLHLETLLEKIDINFKNIRDRKRKVIAYVDPSAREMFFDLFDYSSPTYESDEKYEQYKGTIRHESYHFSQVGILNDIKEKDEVGAVGYSFKLLFEGITIFSVSDHIESFQIHIDKAEEYAALEQTEEAKEAARKDYFDGRIDRAFFRIIDAMSNRFGFSYGGALLFWVWFWKKYTAINPSANFVEDVVKPIYSMVTNNDPNNIESSMTVLAGMLNLPLAFPLEDGDRRANYVNAVDALKTAVKAEAQSITRDFLANMNAKQDYAALGSSFFSTPERPIEHSGYRDPHDYLPNYDVMVSDEFFFGGDLTSRFNGGDIKKRYESIITRKKLNQIILVAMDSFGKDFVKNIKEICSLKENNDKAIIYYIVLLSTKEDSEENPKLPFWDFNNVEQDFIPIDEKHIMYARIKYESKELTSLDPNGPGTDLEKVLRKIPSTVTTEPTSAELAKGNLLITQSIVST